MIKFHLRTSFALLLLGFVLGFCTSSLLNGCNNNPVLAKQQSISPKQLKKDASVIENSYQKTIAELQYQNNELQESLELTKDLLAQAKKATTKRESSIKNLIEPKGFPAMHLVPGFQPLKPNINLAPCDSLIREVVSYIDETHRKDSIYEFQLIQMDSMITIKDALVTANENAYTNLQQLFNQSVSNHEILTKENKLLQRQFKRQRFKSRLLTMGAVMVTGVAANYLLKH